MINFFLSLYKLNLKFHLYFVTGCAMAFIFIVTILAIAICRVQFKRAISTTCNQRSRNSYCQTNRASSIHVPNHRDDLDRPLNRPLDDLQRGNILYIF